MACVLVGVVAGLGARLFSWLLQGGFALFLGRLCHFYPPGAAGEPSPFAASLTGVPRVPVRWLLVLVPALGGLASGLIVNRFAPEASGHGTDAAILSFHRLGGRVRGRVPVVKTIASAVTLGTGGSGGKEGPIAQIGAGFGSLLATRLGMPDSERRLLMLAGVGAGVAAIFKAPLAGALFAGEVLYQSEELEHEALVPSVVASVVSYSVFASVHGFDPVFRTPNLTFNHPQELVGYALLGLLCGALGWLYVKCFYGVHGVFAKLAMPAALKPALGGLLTGLVGLVFPAVLATSYGYLQQALDGQATGGVIFFLALALLKIVTTSFSIGSGGSGGVFGPALVIGGSLGFVVGTACQHLGLIGDARAMIPVGMAGFFGGAAHAPLSTMIMVSEMTGNYQLLVPSMFTCAIAVVCLRGVRLYREQVRDRLASPAHVEESVAALLRDKLVADFMNRDDTLVPAALPLAEAAALYTASGHTRYAVCDESGRVVGILDVRAVLAALLEAQPQAATAADAAESDFATVTPEDSLHDALLLLDNDPHGLLVVTSTNGRDALGTLRRQDMLRGWAAHAA
ncbi:MAG: chloride channel protein [Armatimonadetes bacterium]|nr:chloride channel protein [Armatimonadota bacterium]